VRRTGPPAPKAPPAWEPEEWVEVDEDVRDVASKAVERGGRATRRATQVDDRRAGSAIDEELTRVAGPSTAPKLAQRLADAGRAYERERYDEARKLLRPLADRAPASAAVRELYGLTLYRLGRWRDAQRELEAFRALSGSTEQHPVLADCARALGQWAQVEQLWEELRTASPGAALVAEGRIVAAGALADQGRLPEAVDLLEAGTRRARRAQEHHRRMLYALADLYERAGDVPRARQLFRRVAEADPGFADVAVRLRSLG
jgi:tetratricopeptide (TPR) repeat protein